MVRIIEVISRPIWYASYIHINLCFLSSQVTDQHINRDLRVTGIVGGWRFGTTLYLVVVYPLNVGKCGQAVNAPDHGVAGSNPAGGEILPQLNGASLHRAFHVHLSIVPKWLKYGWSYNSSASSIDARHQLCHLIMFMKISLPFSYNFTLSLLHHTFLRELSKVKESQATSRHYRDRPCETTATGRRQPNHIHPDGFVCLFLLAEVEQ